MKSPRMLKWIFLHIFLISLLACATDRTATQPPPTPVPSQGVVTSILQTLTHTEESGYTRIRLEGSEPISPPIDQVLPNPLRIVVDLPNTDLRKVKEPIKIDNGTVGELWVTQYDDKGRVEIHLTQAANYTLSREGRVLSIDIEQVKKPAETKEEKPPEVKPPEAKEEKPGKELAKEKETEVTPVEIKKEAPAPVASEKTGGSPEGATKESKAKSITDILLEKKEDSVSFTIVADGRLGNYNSFRMESPSRLVVDLWEVDARFDKKRLKLQNPYIKEIRVGQHPDKLRLVFDSLKSPLPSNQISKIEDRLVVSFGNVPQSAELPAASPAPAPSAPAPSVKPSALTGIDFKQMEDKSRIMVSATEEPQAESALVSKKVLAVTVKNSTVPKHLQRDLDTSAFRSAIQSIQLQNIKRGKASDVRILVKLREEMPYETSKEGKTLFIDVQNPKEPEPKTAVVASVPKQESAPTDVKKEEAKAEDVKKEEPKKEEEVKKEAAAPEPKAPAETKTAPKELSGTEEKRISLPPAAKKEDDKKVIEEGVSHEKVYSGAKISLDFKDADIKNILRLIAEVSNLNIITGEEVAGKVTMRLVNVPWDQALDVILSSKNLGMIRVGNVIRIAPQEILKRELQSELEAKRSKEKLEDLMTELVPVNYATAKEILNQVKSVLSERGDIRVDERTNTLIVKDIPRNIVGARNLVRLLDTQTPQVMIEARIIEANLTFQRELGVSWGFVASGGQTSAGTAAATASGGIMPGNKLVDLPAVAKVGTPGIFQFLLNSDQGLKMLDIAVSAHEADGNVKIVSSPNIVTLDNKEASIEQGLRIPYLKATTEGNTSVDFIEANLKLTVTPHVTNDGRIKMNIKVKKDAPDFTVVVLGTPSIDKKEAISEALIKDNGVIVIAGVYTIEKSDNQEGIPLFNRIPLLGWLFKRESKEDKRKDLLIFISPKIIKDQI